MSDLSDLTIRDELARRALGLPAVPIGVAPGGDWASNAGLPPVPRAAAALATAARDCAAAGASWFQIQLRDDDGRVSLDAGRYRESFEAVRAAVGDALLLQLGTEAATGAAPEELMALVRAVTPDAVSLSVREIFGGAVAEPVVVRFVSDLAEQGVAVQFVVGDEADAHRLAAVDSHAGGFLGRAELLLALGSVTQQRPARARDLLALLPSVPSSWRWSVGAVGSTERVCLSAAAALGGGLRTGFETNRWHPDGCPAADNAELVRRLVESLGSMGLRASTVVETRERFGLPPR